MEFEGEVRFLEFAGLEESVKSNVRSKFFEQFNSKTIQAPKHGVSTGPTSFPKSYSLGLDFHKKNPKIDGFLSFFFFQIWIQIRGNG